jgi:hypothetical protein
MEQLPGLTENKKEVLAIKLNSSIYGLQRSAHVWNKKANSAMLQQGLSQSKAGLSLYFRKEDDGSTSDILSCR